MSLLKQLNQVVDYIEENINSDIEVRTLAKMVGINVLHFQALFSCISEITISEYIRNRRLSLAAEELQKGKSVTDVTFDFGYNSLDSFSRAFKKFHGVNPSIAKQQEVLLKAHTKLSFQISVKGVENMNFKIVEKESFYIYGIERIITNKDGENLKEIPEFWNQTMHDGSFKKLIDSTNSEDIKEGIYPVNGIMCYEPSPDGTFPYMIAAFKDETSVTEGFKEGRIGSYKWIVFTTQDYKPSETTAVVQELWRRIYAEWLPSSDYRIIDGPEMELYGKRDENLEYCEVWLPLEKL